MFSKKHIYEFNGKPKAGKYIRLILTTASFIGFWSLGPIHPTLPDILEPNGRKNEGRVAVVKGKKETFFGPLAHFEAATKNSRATICQNWLYCDVSNSPPPPFLPPSPVFRTSSSSLPPGSCPSYTFLPFIRSSAHAKENQRPTTHARAGLPRRQSVAAGLP